MKFQAEYEPHLIWVQDLTKNVLKHAPAAGPNGDLYRADLAGLLSTAYVAAFECSVKAVFNAFASSHNQLLGNVTGFHFERINSKIHWSFIGDNYVSQFGGPYRKEYFEKLDAEEKKILKSEKVSIKETYANLIKWRNAFAHEGKKLTTLEEVTAAYPVAKRVIQVLDGAMSI